MCKVAMRILIEIVQYYTENMLHFLRLNNNVVL